MKKHLMILLALTAVACFRTYAQKAKIDSSESKKLRIDPSMAKGIPVKEIFSEVLFVPLESTKKSLFGEISQLEVVEDKFIIFDFDTWSVLIFNNAGKFINKISSSNVASLNGLPTSNEGSVFNGFMLAKVEGINYIDIASKGTILRFTLDGILSKKIPVAQYATALTLDDGTKVIPNYTRDKKIYYEFLLVDSKGDSTSYWPFAFDRYEEDDFVIGGSRFDISADRNQYLYYNFYSYDLFSISSKGVALKYQILLPNSIALPSDFVSNKDYKFKKWDFLKKNKNMVYGLRNTWLIGDYLYLTLDAIAQQLSNKKTLAYNLKNSQAVSLQNLTPDETSYFLPVNDSAYGTNFLSKGFLNFDGNKLYTTISSLSMMKFKDQSKSLTDNYPTDLMSYFSKDQSEGNPVIVVLTPIK